MSKSILLVDNYDSFTYNLIHYLEELGTNIILKRNDDLENIEHDKFDKILVSPGPGIPKEAGDLMSFLEKNYQTKPILGICLGQQAIVEFFGEKITPLPQVKHGISEYIHQTENDYLYHNIPNRLQVGLYFSWEVILNKNSNLIVTAKNSEGVIMSIKHQFFDIRAVQYHPESIMTTYGKTILYNWINN